MIIGVMGKDGSGKSVLSYLLGTRLSADNVTGVINTDFTYPTLPQRISNVLDRELSLGNYVDSVGRINTSKYLHQDPRNTSLFLAGCVGTDHYFSYQFDIGDELREQQAEYFLESCSYDLGHIVVDLSGQRSDPFLLPVLEQSDCLLVLITPDSDGLMWLASIKPMLQTVTEGRPQLRVFYCAAKKSNIHRLDVFEQEAGITWQYILPMSLEIAYNDAKNDLQSESRATVEAREYLDQLSSITAQILEGGKAHG